MYPTLNAAGNALGRDGWKSHTVYWWFKVVSGRAIWCEIDRDGDGYNVVFLGDLDE